MPHIRSAQPTPTLAGSGAASDEPRRASARLVAIASLGVALIVSVPSWFIGFSNDDLSQRLLLEGAVPAHTAGWLGLYDFTPPSMPTSALIEQGLLPWFTEPELRLRFLRPISSFTLALDHALFGRDALPAHIHTTLWMLALAAVAGQLYRRWLPARAALLASILFALSPVHAIPLSWLASRHTLVAATFGALALWAWLQHAASGNVRWRVLSIASLAASLLSSESGLVALVLITGHELAHAHISLALRRAAPALVTGVIYLLGYAALGYGTHASAFYVSPFDAPLDYVRNALLGVPALSAELLLGVPSVIAVVEGRPALLALAGLGVLASVAAWSWLRALAGAVSSSERRELAWLSLGTLVGLGALTGAPVSGRVLPLSALGTAGLCAVLLERSWTLARRAPAQLHAAPRGRWRWLLALALAAPLQLGLGPLLRLAMPAQFAQAVSTQRGLAENADVGRCAQRGSLYLINGSDPTLALYAAAALRFYTPEKAGAERLRVLSMAPAPQRLTRLAPGLLELEVLDSDRPSTPFEQLFRGPAAPLVVGQRVALAEMNVSVEAATRGLLMRSRFERASGFHEDDTCLLVWRRGRLENEPLPAVGDSIDVGYSRGPMNL